MRAALRPAPSPRSNFASAATSLFPPQVSLHHCVSRIAASKLAATRAGFWCPKMAHPDPADHVEFHAAVRQLHQRPAAHPRAQVREKQTSRPLLTELLQECLIGFSAPHPPPVRPSASADVRPPPAASTRVRLHVDPKIIVRSPTVSCRHLRRLSDVIQCDLPLANLMRNSAVKLPAPQGCPAPQILGLYAATPCMPNEVHHRNAAARDSPSHAPRRRPPRQRHVQHPPALGNGHCSTVGISGFGGA